MVRLSRNRISTLLELGDAASTTTEKGIAFEELVCYIFGKVPGITITQRNEQDVFGAGEIDVALWNDMNSNGFYFLPHIILIECKNWSDAVGSNEVSWFKEKLGARGLDLGILVAANGITGDSVCLSNAHQIIARALAEGVRLIVVRRNEIVGLASTEALVQLIKKKLCDLAVSGTTL